MKYLLKRSKTELAKVLVERLVSSLPCVVDMTLAIDVCGKDEQNKL